MWHNLSEKMVLEKLGSGRDGLSLSEAKKRLVTYGENSFGKKKRKSFLKAFAGQLSDGMVIILLAAAAISVSLSFISGEGEYLDAIIILAIVLFNALTGVVQEFKAEHALEALKKMNSPHASVVRDGKESVIDNAEVVPGDVMILSAGDFVPADARLLEASGLTVDESALTGETKEAHKMCRIEDVNISETEAGNMVWAQTVITGGRGKAVAVATGLKTRTGRVAGMIMNSETPETPLQQRLKKTGNVLGVGAIAICGLIFIMGILRRQPAMEMFMTSVSLAVAAIPEGLSAIITVMLAIGVQKMAGKNAVVRKLPAVETLGSATVICSDKTGTLTCNKMTVTEIFGNKKKFLECCCLCSDNRGATEKALVKAAENEEISKTELDSRMNRVEEIPFSSARKMMTTVHKTESGYIVVTKGAPEKILPVCAIGEEKKREILTKNREMAARGNRVIAAAYKEVTEIGGEYEQNLIFAGLAAISDPPRKGVREAVSECRDAGINVVMITGDQPDTALAIAKETGICNGGDRAIEGKELDRMNDGQLEEKVADFKVFARVTPEHKMRIVRAFQRRGEVVAMTGDGVNDAPALKYADIGCAMGKSGTEVAKGAADIVLADDNFVTIGEAVKQGRGIYANIRKAVRFLLSSNIGEIFTIFVAIFFGRKSPLTAIQLLWTNLVTDSLPAVALGLRPADVDIMSRKPVPKNQSLFADGLGITICLEGIMIGLIATVAYAVGANFYGNAELGNTMTFCALSMSQLFHAFAVESEHSVFCGDARRNKYMLGAFAVCMGMQVSAVAIAPLRNIFGTCAMTGEQWMITLGLSALPLVISEAEKIGENAKSKSGMRKIGEKA